MFALNAIGLVMVISASTGVSDDGARSVISQIIYTVIGFLLMFTISVLPEQFSDLVISFSLLRAFCNLLCCPHLA